VNTIRLLSSVIERVSPAKVALTISLFLVLGAFIASFTSNPSPDLTGTYVAIPDKGRESLVEGQGPIYPPYVVLRIIHDKHRISGELRPLSSDNSFESHFRIIDGSLDEGGYLQLELQEERMKDISVSASLFGVSVSAPALTGSVSISSLVPIEDAPEVLELDSSIRWGGALGTLAGISFQMAGKGDPTTIQRTNRFYRVNNTRLKLTNQDAFGSQRNTPLPPKY
jgi:hypothetical protein